MNKDLKNKLLILAASAGLATMGIACGDSAPAEEGESAETAGGEEEAADDEGAAEGEGSCSGGEGGEGSCGEGSCS